MVKMANVGDAVDERDVYTPPCVVRISDLKQGAGDGYCEKGSGDAHECFTGNSASVCCFNNGNSPNGFCTNVGNGYF